MSASTDLSLLEAFELVPDPRKARGVRYSLNMLLTLAALAIAGGARSVYAIGEFAQHRPELAAALGFKRKHLPCQGTFHYLFKALNIAKFEAALSRWARAFCPSDGSPIVIHIDGKALRGSRREAIDCVHLLSAYCAEAGVTLAQMQVHGKTNEPKTALELLRLIPMKNVIVTGDAIFTQRDLTAQVVEDGGNYLLTVKDNQKTLRTEIENAFEENALPPRATGTQGGSAHGRDARQRARAHRQTPYRNALAHSELD